jgi:hypothetical protein
MESFRTGMPYCPERGRIIVSDPTAERKPPGSEHPYCTYVQFRSGEKTPPFAGAKRRGRNREEAFDRGLRLTLLA